MTEVVPFPLARRRGLIERQAAWFGQQNPVAAEATLRRQLQVQREAMLRKGVDAQRAAEECLELEAAIRSAACRFERKPGGAA